MERSIEPLPRADWALFLDVDGTLLDIAELPAAVVVPDKLPDALAAAGRALDGALALVSGRPIAELDAMFAPLRLAAAGQHGCEIRLAADRPVAMLASRPIDGAVHQQLAAIIADHPATWIEAKGHAIAIHYRRAPTAGDSLGARLREVVAGNQYPLALVPGRMVWEIRDAGHSKATAVEAFMRESTFAGRLPVFVGDDWTDEDGFSAVERHGGLALPVGGVHQATRQSAFQCPAAVRDWLARLPQHLARSVA